MKSVLEIRTFLTEVLMAGVDKNDVGVHLVAMRAAGRKFLDTVQREDVVNGMEARLEFARWIFDAALGEFRGAVGIHLGLIAAKHGVDVESDLVTILPGDDSTDWARAGDV